MRIDELTRPKSQNEASGILLNAGWTYTGSGSFGTVFNHPQKNYVIKLVTTRDYAYWDFASAVNKNPNPFWPRFRGAPIRISPKYFAVRMEMLSDIDTKSRLYSAYAYTRDFLNGFHTILTSEHDPKSKKKYIKDLIDEHRHGIHDFENLYPDATNTLMEIAQGGGYALDIKWSNVMARGDHIVLIDPIWNGDGSVPYPE